MPCPCLSQQNVQKKQDVGAGANPPMLGHLVEVDLAVEQSGDPVKQSTSKFEEKHYSTPIDLPKCTEFGEINQGTKAPRHQGLIRQQVLRSERSACEQVYQTAYQIGANCACNKWKPIGANSFARTTVLKVAGLLVLR